ncbi:hypothetical protein ABL78_8294 [Leptomonas seymouri]|uniref:Transmembrane protein n=1 Tax=Leptomonas seymouri TaxID=5684 RepID=A0A0N1HR76_LEPSE|nr:hypothetical protein ABL78_8294 [Leptomonas seymouri]|eukprot:KPI82694.1 hypothetical protein ABL78_8294 [Leptomonas seymouri]
MRDRSSIGHSSSNSSSHTNETTKDRSSIGHSSSNSSSHTNETMRDRSSSGHSSSTSSTTPPTTTSTTTTAAPKPTKNNDNESTMSIVAFMIVLFIIIGVILYGSRSMPSTCPFFRGNGRGHEPHTQQYVRLDSGTFNSDEEGYEGMQANHAVNVGGFGGLRTYQPMRRNMEDNDCGGLNVEMQEEYKGRAGVPPALGQVTVTGYPIRSRFPNTEKSVQMSDVVDRSPAALDALFASPNTSPQTPAPIPLHSKNSLRAMRKVKLAPASSVTPFGGAKNSASDGNGAVGSKPQSNSQHSMMSLRESQPKDNGGWSDDDQDK